MSLLEHAQAQALLADAEVTPAAVRSCLGRLRLFLARYLRCFPRSEQRELAEVVLSGKLSGLQRKTAEPIAYLADRPRKPVQHFVGAGAWDDDALLAELRRHVAEVVADPEGVLVLDGSGFAKKGEASCGVQRQSCGRLGQVENCQVGLFLAYVAAGGAALVDRRLYLPEGWANDPDRRGQTHVPEAVAFQEGWRIGLGLIDRARADLPFGWVAGDDEYGRATEFRAGLRRRELRYVLDVPCSTLVRDIDEGPPPGSRCPPWRRVDEWARRLPASRWRRVEVGPGSKGPQVVRAAEGWVQTRGEGGRVGAVERVVVIRTIDREPVTWYTLSNAPARVGVAAVAKAHARRHGVEELLQVGKGEVGLGHYEVRSWVGWHHHMTLSLLAVWFLQLERRHLGGESPGVDGAATARGVQPPVAATADQRAADRPGGQPGATPHRGGPHLPLVRPHREVPASPRPTRRVERLQ
ncbi:MAG: IS701 family transposase [Gemmataceae bacterium]